MSSWPSPCWLIIELRAERWMMGWNRKLWMNFWRKWSRAHGAWTLPLRTCAPADWYTEPGMCVRAWMPCWFLTQSRGDLGEWAGGRRSWRTGYYFSAQSHVGSAQVSISRHTAIVDLASWLDFGISWQVSIQQSQPAPFFLKWPVSEMAPSMSSHLHEVAKRRLTDTKKASASFWVLRTPARAVLWSPAGRRDWHSGCRHADE
jgi:hypothetical protein